jgi:tetratricopeptide (TPR) repeat protein
LARVLREQKRLDEAVTHLQVVIHLNPRRFDAYAMLGEIRREQKKPQQAAAMFNMAAWLLATSPDDTKRNGRMAVGLASNAMNAAGGQTPELLDTMAAALAEAGNFDQAVKAAEQAANMLAAQSEQATTAAEKQRCAELAAAIRFRMELYKKKQKFRDERPVKSGE